MRVAINGFGRIGRMTAKILLAQSDIKLVAINDLADSKTLTHLLKYDSVHGHLNLPFTLNGDDFTCANHELKFYREKNPSKLPWKDLDVDVVIESTGIFKTKELASLHLKAGAKKVIISAPSPDLSIPMVVLGVNGDILTDEMTIISNASCTTNSAAPLIELLDEICGIESCYITTVHSYTGDQRLQDAPHGDLRRARAAGQSIVPTTTGAAKALTRIFPQLADKIGGCGIRVPVPDGSLTDITCSVTNVLSIEQINLAFKNAANNRFKGILEYTADPIVSVDVIGNTHSCVFDSQLTSVIGNMVKLVGWYDNEIGYSNRLVDLLKKISSL
jgi:glyceraldehyde 3-phosphate dehydrogenase